jgi:2'-5' RNA ligase
VAARRVFFALKPDARTRSLIRRATDDLQLERRLRWLNQTDWHVTVRFVGDVDEGLFAALSDVVPAVASRHDRFDVGLGLIESFPSAQRPVVVAATGASTASALALVDDLETVCQDLGVRADERPWRCHMSLARVRGRGRYALEPREIDATFKAASLYLMESVVIGEKRRYVPVADASLG